jgi:hypothetical protein
MLDVVEFEVAVPTLRGFGTYELTRERVGRPALLLQDGEFSNLVTQVGDQWYGDRAAGTSGSGIYTSPTTITAITNAASAVVSATAHGLGVGDIVIISGVTPAGYNGTWAITAVTANTFTIYVGTALGAGSAFGTAKGLTLPPITGARLGTGSTAVAKTGAGAAIVTYTSGSNHALASSFPASSLQGSSRQEQWQIVWTAGQATASGLNEVVLTFESPLSDVAGTAANTVSRALLSPVVNKGASDTLTVTWNHQLLGA